LSPGVFDFATSGALKQFEEIFSVELIYIGFMRFLVGQK
jgi:hypothetical protein